jgi:hypothetical protein
MWFRIDGCVWEVERCLITQGTAPFGVEAPQLLYGYRQHERGVLRGSRVGSLHLCFPLHVLRTFVDRRIEATGPIT